MEVDSRVTRLAARVVEFASHHQGPCYLDFVEKVRIEARLRLCLRTARLARAARRRRATNLDDLLAEALRAFSGIPRSGTDGSVREGGCPSGDSMAANEPAPWPVVCDAGPVFTWMNWGVWTSCRTFRGSSYR